MYVCDKCNRDYVEKPNGRCPVCGGIVKRTLDREERKRGNRNRFQKARKMKRGEEW